MIYPLNQQIETLIFMATDEESGEINCTDEELNEAIETLALEFDQKIYELRNYYLDTRLQAKRVEAEAKVLREEAANVQKRANSLNNKAERVGRFIAYLLNGEKFDKNGAKITYRKSEECVIDDRFVEWAKAMAPDLLKTEPRKADIKAALKSGAELEYAHIEERSNIQIK